MVSPSLHQFTASFQSVAAPICALNLTANKVRERQFRKRARKLLLLRTPVAK